jgi:hypothetical protein
LSASLTAPLSRGTRWLLFFTTIIAAAAAFITCYATGTGQINRLQQAGFAPWPGSSAAQDGYMAWDPFSSVMPCSAWYQFVQFGSLAFAFVPDPLVRAVLAGGGLLVAGFCALAFSLEVDAPPRPWHMRYGQTVMMRGNPYVVAGMCCGAFIAIASLLPRPNAGFTIDLGQGIIADSVLRPGDTIRMTPQTNLNMQTAVYYYGYHHDHRTYYYENASNDDGHGLVLFRLGDISEAYAIEQLITDFITSGGQKI